MADLATPGPADRVVVPDTAPDRLPNGWPLVRFDETPSTNDVARDLASTGAEPGTTVLARAQTGGRGTRGRDWTSPPGNLYASVVLRPEVPPGEAAQLGFVTALAVAGAVETLVPGARARVKWPNDVLVDGAKIAGILLETEARDPSRVDWVVVGCGLNLATHPTGTARPATSIAALGGVADPEGTVGIYTRGLENWTERWRREGFAPVRAAWLERAHGLGAEIEIGGSGPARVGRFVDLDGAGRLLLEETDGRVTPVCSGEVVFRFENSASAPCC